MEYSEVDLSLPRAKLIKRYVDSSHTPVALLKGYYGNVVFEPWHDFEAMLDKAKQKLDGMDESAKKEVIDDLQKCRKQLGNLQTEGASSNSSGQRGELVSMTSLVTSLRSATNEAPRAVGRVAGVERTMEINRNQGEEDFGFTNCTSMSRITEIVFLALEEIISSIKDRKLYLKCLNFSVNALQSTIFPNPDADLNWKKLEPDFSLSKHFNVFNKKEYRPYATFELKGPARRLYKWKSGYQCDPRRVDSDRDGQNLVEDSAECLATFCNAGFLETPEEDTEGSSNSKYNEQQNNSTTSDVGTNEKRKLPRLRPPLLYLVPIAQALTQGLISATGCCMLYNHQNAVAFKICGLQPPENGKIRVLVSRQFDCEEQKGTLLAVLALMLHSLELYTHRKDRKELREKLSEALLHLYDWTVLRNKKKTEKRQAEDTGDAETEEKRQKTGDSSAAQRHASIQDSPDSLSETTLCTEQTDTTPNSVMKTEEKGTRDRVESRCMRFDGSVIRNGEAVGQGYSGTVRLRENGGEKLIIKTWNMEEDDGLKELQNEIKVYKILSGEKHNVQGGAMPVLKGFINESSPSAGIIIEHVGMPIREDEDGSLVIGDDRHERTLAPPEATALRKAAIDSLRSIHSTGFLHGDVALRNLRVVRGDGAEASLKKTWRACWIDYGRANTTEASNYNKAFEIEMCRSLFAEAENERCNKV